MSEIAQTHSNRDALLELARETLATVMDESQGNSSDGRLIRDGNEHAALIDGDDVITAMLKFAALASRPSPVGRDEVESAIKLAEEYAEIRDWNGAYHAMRLACSAALKSQPSSTAGEVCSCPCHKGTAIMHVRPCCDGVA
ncbi:hypothetical protein [Sphingomonas turrisvirgatae]|uniref:Uncharacterized protein n=1 Tax=Sphingomonas turrisvirgatae TaxID=1888892 RepID=A0A1E3LZP5_9SPHN|nr:hypothetical protein [Sphingomonas turrisvirgatae]ODP39241.1 hypothetical protein BFL28_10525 [Sphingomonas turrisvirgatae]